MTGGDRFDVGDLNRRALEPQPHAVVALHETTLSSAAPAPEDALALAQALDAAGVDRIELACVPAGAAEAAELVAGAGLAAELWGRAEAEPAAIEAVVAAGLRRAVLAAPATAAGAGALAHAVEQGLTVAFLAVDATRAGLDAVRRSFAAAADAGARELVVEDTAGIATPEAAAYLVADLVEWVQAPVHWRGRDDFGVAVAASVAAVQAGAAAVHGDVLGLGGGASLLRVALALEALYGIPTRLDLAQAEALVEAVRRGCDPKAELWAPPPARPR